MELQSIEGTVKTWLCVWNINSSASGSNTFFHFKSYGVFCEKLHCDMCVEKIDYSLDD